MPRPITLQRSKAEEKIRKKNVQRMDCAVEDENAKKKTAGYLCTFEILSLTLVVILLLLMWLMQH